ncbi:DUF3307 domain-containing protein [Cupriavidus sp. Marseille-Q8015]
MIDPHAFFPLLFWLLVGHVLADYPLQGDFLATAKDHTTPLGKVFWPHALGAHSMIHAGFVAFFTGSVVLGLAEAVIHAATDRLKCAKRISLNVDQGIHFVCKLVWATVTVWCAA